MTDLKELAEASAVDGMVRLEFVKRLMDLAVKEAELERLTEKINA